MKPDVRPRPDLDKVRIGVSACLLGDKVRYDGGQKKNDFLTRTLSSFVTWIPICPGSLLFDGVRLRYQAFQVDSLARRLDNHNWFLARPEEALFCPAAAELENALGPQASSQPEVKADAFFIAETFEVVLI